MNVDRNWSAENHAVTLYLIHSIVTPRLGVLIRNRVPREAFRSCAIDDIFTVQLPCTDLRPGLMLNPVC
jgi:hypothetical protein